MKDAKGHGSNTRGKGQTLPADQWKNTARAIARAATTPGTVEYDRVNAHAAGVESVGGRKVTIFHQDGEYAIPNAPGGKGHTFANDKADAEATARHMHGHDITIKHRSKRWGPEMD